MKRKSHILGLSVALVSALALAFTGCPATIETETPATPERSTNSENAYKVPLNADGTITISLSALNSDFASSSARTIAPKNPDLYYTVFGATAKNDDGDASFAYTAGDVTYEPYYADEVNKTDSITFTIGAGTSTTKTWYFTAYGTKEKPSSITGVSDLITAKTHYGASGAVSKIAEKALVKGTLGFTIEIADDGTATFKSLETNTPTLAKLTITVTNVAGSAAKGSAIIPITIPDTSALKEYYQIASATLTIKKGGTATQTITYTPTAGLAAGDTFAFIAKDLPADTYDVEVTFTSIKYKDSSKDDQEAAASKSREVYSFNDKLTVWAGYESVVSGGSTVIGSANISYTKAISATGASLETLETAGSQKGYTVTADQIKKYQRTKFYVSASGADDTGTGSLYQPLKTLEGASKKIPQLADGKEADANGTEWTIYIIGDVTAGTATATSIENYSSNDAWLTITKYGTDPATVSGDVSFVNGAGAGNMRVKVEEVTFTGNFTVATPYLYLGSNAKLTPGSGKYVVLDKGDDIKNGTLNAAPSNTTASVTSIQLKGQVGTTVVRTWNGDFSSTALPARLAANAGFTNDATATSAPAWVGQYVFDTTWASEKNADNKGYKRVLKVNTDIADVTTTTDEDGQGDLIAKYESGTASPHSASINLAGSDIKANVAISLSSITLEAGNGGKLTFSFENSNTYNEKKVTITPTYTLKSNEAGSNSTGLVSGTDFTVSDIATSPVTITKAADEDTPGTGSATADFTLKPDGVKKMDTNVDYVLGITYVVKDSTNTSDAGLTFYDELILTFTK